MSFVLSMAMLSVTSTIFMVHVAVLTAPSLVVTFTVSVTGFLDVPTGSGPFALMSVLSVKSPLLKYVSSDNEYSMLSMELET